MADLLPISERLYDLSILLVFRFDDTYEHDVLLNHHIPVEEARLASARLRHTNTQTSSCLFKSRVLSAPPPGQQIRFMTITQYASYRDSQVVIDKSRQGSYPLTAPDARPFTSHFCTKKV